MRRPKRALVTGAGRGIGLAIAKALDALEWQLILITRTEKSRARLTKTFPQAKILRLDLGDSACVLALPSQLRGEVPYLDALVNNAGSYVGKPFEATTCEDLNQLYQVHVKAPFLLIQGLLSLLKKSPHPCVINISSAATVANLPTEAAYTSAKAALTALGRVLQLELQDHRIRVTTIHPWTVNTKHYDGANNLGLRPEDVAAVIVHVLCGHPSCQILNVELSSLRDWRGSWPPWADHRTNRSDAKRSGITTRNP